MAENLGTYGQQSSFVGAGERLYGPGHFEGRLDSVATTRATSQRLEQQHAPAVESVEFAPEPTKEEILAFGREALERAYL